MILLSFEALTHYLVVIHGSAAVIRHKDFGNTPKVLIHVDMCCNPRVLLLIHKCFHIWILAVGHYSYENVGIQDFAGIRVNDMCRISGPANLNLLSGLAVDVHGGAVLLLVLLDIITELGMHERLITSEATFLKAFCPEELLVYSVAEQFLADVGIIRHTLGCLQSRICGTVSPEWRFRIARNTHMIDKPTYLTVTPEHFCLFFLCIWGIIKNTVYLIRI